MRVVVEHAIACAAHNVELRTYAKVGVALVGAPLLVGLIAVGSDGGNLGGHIGGHSPVAIGERSVHVGRILLHLGQSILLGGFVLYGHIVLLYGDFFSEVLGLSSSAQGK